jgi:spore germination protein
MRDIVYKKVDASSPEAIPLKSPPLPSKKESGFVRALRAVFTTVNTGSAILGERLDAAELTIITPAQEASQTIPSVKTTKQKRVRAQATKKIIASTKETAQKARRALRTSAGKVAVVHSLAILALVGYIAYTKTTTAQATQHVVTTAGTDRNTVRQYLPSGTNSVISAFKETEASVPHSETSLNAWLTPWNINDLSQNADSYKTLSAFWLTLNSNGYDLTPKADWAVWNSFVKTHHNKNQPLYLTISADPNISYLALTNLDIQQKQIANLLYVVKQQNFDGIDIDYEGLGAENRDLFTNFVRTLTTAFHNEKKLVAVTVEARIGNQVPLDWRNLGIITDQVRIMAYDYHSRNTGFPGPISPLAWVKEVVEYASTNIDPSKVIIGLGNYGYDWQQKSDDPNSWQGVGVSFDQAVALSKDKNAPITQATGIDSRGYDIGSIPMFTYKDDQGNQHSVWFEDKDSLQAKVNLVSQYPVQGVIFWSVGLGDQNFWTNTSSAN